jgi:hypothetical protein
MHFQTLTVASLLLGSLALPQYDPDPYGGTLLARQTSPDDFSSLQVDLGYGIYQGYNNASSGLNLWKGIRFAEPPTGSRRWQAPRAPQAARQAVVQANRFGQTCPQGQDSTNRFVLLNSTGSSEDCLFLNVYAPPNPSQPLPVLVYIHGGKSRAVSCLPFLAPHDAYSPHAGGYGRGNGQLDLSAIINTNNKSFVGVTIQYRVCLPTSLQTGDH